MTIFYHHVVVSMLGAILLLTFLKSKEYVKDVLLPCAFGFLVGILIFSGLKSGLSVDSAKPYFEAVCIISLVILFIAYFVKNRYLYWISSFLLTFGYAFFYMFVSMNFNIFAGELLDSSSLINLFMVLFAFFTLIGLFLCQKFILKQISTKLVTTAFSIIILVLIIDRAAFLVLSLMQEGVIDTEETLLSIIAKIIYINNFLAVCLAVFVSLLAIIALKSMPKKISKDSIVAYRQNISQRFKVLSNFSIFILLNFLVVFFSLFYILVASKPPQIDDPILVEPTNGEFKFDANIVLDGKLHRFAYIADDGHEIRFFLINRHTGKLAPVAVFDACSICGDMGYVKHGDNLICISCNVRIYLPSVGRAGGCNPIPLEHKFDGKNIIIKLKSVLDGASFFSKIVEKDVIDPVSRKSIKNTTKHTYLYYGRTYFFENEDNLVKFEENADKYVTADGELKEVK